MLLMIAAIILVTVGAGFAYVSTVLNATTKSFSKTYSKINEKSNQTIKATKPLTILLMGVDTGGDRGGSQDWNGNSDSQIVMTLNPKTHTTTMISMERDTMTNILDDQGNIISTQKMNAAYPSGYNAGGFDGAVKYAMTTIGAQAGVNIDNFVTMNFDGIQNLVNNVGGITVDNTSGTTLYISNTEPDYTATVPPGVQHINGEQALVYARDRDHLPNGDYGRAAHQREVISAVTKKLISLDNITQYQKFLNDISQDFKTNIAINASTLPSLAAYKDCFDKVVSVQYQGIGDEVDGVSYQFMPQETDLAVQNVMRKSLGESTIDTLDNSVITYESYFGAQASGYLLPSATVTEKGKSTTYGVSDDGSLVNINADNSGQYVSTSGAAVTSDQPASSSSESVASSSSTPQTSPSDDSTADTTTYNQ